MSKCPAFKFQLVKLPKYYQQNVNIYAKLYFYYSIMFNYQTSIQQKTTGQENKRQNYIRVSCTQKH